MNTRSHFAKSCPCIFPGHDGASCIAQSRTQHGATLVELALTLPLVMILLLVVIDFGRAYYLSIEIENAARAAVQYGAQSTATMVDSAGIVAAATNEAKDISTSTSCGSDQSAGSACWSNGGSPITNPAPYYGCECSNATSGNSGSNCPVCTSPAQATYYVSVNTQANYKTLVPWPGLPATFTLTGQAKMRLGAQ